MHMSWKINSDILGQSTSACRELLPGRMVPFSWEENLQKYLKCYLGFLCTMADRIPGFELFLLRMQLPISVHSIIG